jgi:Ca2+/Na+ antiporter
VGIGCSIGMLFIMLLLVFISIVAFKWEMTKPMGGVMMVLYVIFVVVSLGLSECWFACPF